MGRASGRKRHVLRHATTVLLVFAVTASSSQFSAADENGISFWLPGTFGSLAATPQQPGWALGAIYFHTSLAASGSLSGSRAVQVGRFNPTLSANLNADLHARGDVAILAPSYVFANPLWGGQLALSLAGVYGRVDTNLDATVTGALGPIGFGRSFNFNDSVTGFGDLYPQAVLRWNQGVHNFMTYTMANLPVGAYEAGRLSNIGLGHWAVDGGFGYTYFNPAKGHEFSVVTGLTHNFRNPHTDYRNGLDWHLDWGASQFLSKQVQVGAVGYFFHQLTADEGAPAILGDFKSRVIGIGPQIGFIFPVGDQQGYLNFKAYKEFDAFARPEGWNAWVTFAISPADKTMASAQPKSMMRK